MSRSDWPIIGNPKAIEFFESLLSFERRSSLSIGGTYLVVGPNKIGRTSAIEYFIRELLGESSPTAGQTLDMWPDVFRLRRIEDKLQIGVAEAREWSNRLTLSSFSESYRIGIVHEADLLSHEAANALLKSLEEARDRVIIFMIAEMADRLPATVVSRSQKIVFHPVAIDEVYEWLVTEHGLDRPFAKNIARLSNGRPGLALDLMRDKELLESYLEPARFFVNAFRLRLHERWQKLPALLAAGPGAVNERALEIVQKWRSVARDIMMVLLNQPELMRYAFLEKEIRQTATLSVINETRQLEERLRLANTYLRANVNPNLVLENILINL